MTMTNKLIMIPCFVVVFIYFIADSYAIVNGKFDKMVTRDDYIYGSSKIFVDFVLIFTLLANLLNHN